MSHDLWIINPQNRKRYNWDLKDMVRLMGKKALTTPLALPLLAALTPEGFDITIIDENVDSRKPVKKPDLVAISVWISNRKRAFELADGFRKEGIPVVLGGPEVSDWPDEAEAHADAIVIGEAEGTWPALLDDFRAGELKKRYRAGEFCSFTTSPPPRWDLVDTESIMSIAVQVSRGCPYACDFCNVRYLFGRKFRYRDVDDVIRELSTVPPGLIVSFADDNFIGNRPFTSELLEKMEPLGLQWNCQASIDCAFDLPLLDRMKAAGCTTILIGIESLDQETLKEINKKQNDAGRYREAVENIQSRGMFVSGAFIAGFDRDTPEIFPKLIDFVADTGMAYIMLNALYAYPNSDLYRRMEQQGRIIDMRSRPHTAIRSNIDYKNFTGRELSLHILRTLDDVYSWDNLRRKGEVLLMKEGFDDEKPRDIPASVKARISLHFLLRYIIFASFRKRAFFFAMLRLIRRKGRPVGIVMQYILFNDSFRSYLKDVARY